MDKDEKKMIDITGDLKDLYDEEMRKMAEELYAELNEGLEDWFYNLPSIKRCTIDKSIFEEMNKRGVNYESV